MFMSGHGSSPILGLHRHSITRLCNQRACALHSTRFFARCVFFIAYTYWGDRSPTPSATSFIDRDLNGLTEEISTLVMIYSALSLLILVPVVRSVPILSLASLRSRSLSRTRTSRTRSTGRRFAGTAPGYPIENGKTGHGCRGAHEKI
jgi:hypothetical protein